MKVRKAVRCELVGLTRRKRELLNREYDNFQHYLRTGEDKGVYSATKQQGKRTYRKIDPEKEYPLVIRKDLMDIRKTDNKLATYWARIPVHGVRGGVRVALAHQPFNFEEWEVCGSKLVRTEDGEFYLHVTVEKEVELKKEYSSIMAVDVAPAGQPCRWHGTVAA